MVVLIVVLIVVLVVVLVVVFPLRMVVWQPFSSSLASAAKSM